MNIPIRRVIMVAIVLVVILIANATYVQVFKADSLVNNPHNNGRVLLDEYARQRGQITAGGDVIAVSHATDDRLKYLRSYPEPWADAYAPVTGYYSFTYNSSGLEQAENSVLSGNDDRLFGQRFLDMFSGRDPRGGNVITTINPKMQQAAWNGMQHGCNGVCRGAVVALDPTTGAILAMVSSPSYDPNPLSSHDGDEQQKAWASYDPAAPDSPMLNRALRQTYPPGSTFKVVTTATALAQGVDPDSTRLTAGSGIKLPGTDTTLTNYAGETCPGSSGGQVTLRQAFQYSCNTAFVQLATTRLQNPISSVEKQASAFGIGSDAPSVPLSVANSQFGDPANLAQLGMSSIGQFDVSITPLQNAMIAATVANGGTQMKPYLVDKLQSPDLKTLHTTKPSSMGTPISPQVAQQLTSLMIDSERHTAGATPNIASKTGTAEHSNTSAAEDETPYAWYIAFGPTSNAKVAVAVLVENGSKGFDTTGSSSAAPIGRAVIQAGTGA
ncbi:penicillin-binding transpeptidase domain-containing protein [Jongsikchunia kroppenstedtii]|uniref:penicillin-binding transpeptidase domain-containing protein n=1 Tax=Jongsikchunia kroppenstedtii TaxID=1121721 RepID=UPI000378EC7C|nr:penicillin-binding protein 2 [Jongsikchunia kroppenstedtii]